MECTEKGCGGKINEEITVQMQTGCVGSHPAHPCRECGRLHWKDGGKPIFNRRDKKAFLVDGKIHYAEN